MYSGTIESLLSAAACGWIFGVRHICPKCRHTRAIIFAWNYGSRGVVNASNREGSPTFVFSLNPLLWRAIGIASWVWINHLNTHALASFVHCGIVLRYM